MSSFGITSGSRRIGPQRMNKSLRRQILKRKQRIGHITSGAPIELPLLPGDRGERVIEGKVGPTAVKDKQKARPQKARPGADGSPESVEEMLRKHGVESTEENRAVAIALQGIEGSVATSEADLEFFVSRNLLRKDLTPLQRRFYQAFKTKFEKERGIPLSQATFERGGVKVKREGATGGSSRR